MTKETFNERMQIPDTISKLRAVIEMHDILIDFVVKSNDLYAFPTLLIIISIFLYIVFGLFAEYR